MNKIALIALLGLASTTVAMPVHDRVTKLPDCGMMPSNWYSGYMDASQGKHLHYVYIESLNVPSTDPVLIWLNGGPGCSSMLGLFQENGPFVIDDGEYIIKPNAHSWNTNHNMLYIESPAGVGYSIAETPADLETNDMLQSVDLLKALQSFYAKFPTLRQNDLYISGESYAGIYVPYLAWQIYQSNL
jgi:cathepsin A (carboxypeptidase C)